MQSCRAALTAGALAFVMLAGAGCSSSSKSSSSPSPTPAAPTATTQGTAQFCSDYDALKESLQKLASLNVVAVGTDGLKTAVDDVKQKASALSDSAGVFKPQVTALNTAIDNLRTTVQGLSGGGLASSLPKLGQQIAAVGTAGQQLGSAVKSACPTTSSS